MFLGNIQDFCFLSSRAAPLFIENMTETLNGNLCKIQLSNLIKFSW